MELEKLKTHFIDGQVLTSDNLNSYVDKLNEIIEAYGICINDASTAVFAAQNAYNDASLAATSAETSRQYMENIQALMQSLVDGDSSTNNAAIEAINDLRQQMLDDMNAQKEYFEQTVVPEINYVQGRIADISTNVDDRLKDFQQMLDADMVLMTYDEYKAVTPKKMRFYFVAKDEVNQRRGLLWRVYIKNMVFAENTDTGITLSSKFSFKFPFKFA